MAKITYADKVALNENEEIADINKVNASDMNEIKRVVNENENTPAFAYMSVNGIKQVQPQQVLTITEYVNGVSYGNFSYILNEGKLVIPEGTNAVRIGGMVCGYGTGIARLVIYSTDGVAPEGVGVYQQIGILVNASGNKYWKQALPSKVCKLDNTKTYIVQLQVEGYNGEVFSLNEGFGTGSSWIEAQKIA